MDPYIKIVINEDVEFKTKVCESAGKVPVFEQSLTNFAFDAA